MDHTHITRAFNPMETATFPSIDVPKSFEIGNIIFAPDMLNPVIDQIFSTIRQQEFKVRLEQACKGAQVLAIKIPAVAQEFINATFRYSSMGSFLNYHHTAVKAFGEGGGMEDGPRKVMCYLMKRMDDGWKPMAEWRGLFELLKLPRTEKRALAALFVLCEELRDRAEDFWGPLRDKMGSATIAVEDEDFSGNDEVHQHYEHPISEPHRDQQCFRHLLEDMFRDQNLRVARSLSLEARSGFPKLLAALIRLEKAFEALKPEFNELHEYGRRIMRSLDPQAVADIVGGRLKAVLDENTAAKRDLEKQQVSVACKLNGRRERSLFAEFEGAERLLDVIYAEELSYLKITVSKIIPGHCECPHDLPDTNVGHEAPYPVFSDPPVLANVIERLAELSQVSEHGQLVRFSSAATEVYRSIKAFLAFREEHSKALHAAGNEFIDKDGPQLKESWSVLKGLEAMLLESLHAYRALVATHEELQHTVAISSDSLKSESTNIKPYQTTLSETFAYLAMMRVLFSDSLFMVLLHCRKSSTCMRDPPEMMSVSPHLFDIWFECRHNIHTQHSALAKVSFDADNGRKTASEAKLSSDSDDLECYLVSQKLTKERMTNYSKRAMKCRNQLEKQVDALKAYAEMYAEDEIAQEVTHYLDAYTKPVTQIMRLFETVVLVAQH